MLKKSNDLLERGVVDIIVRSSLEKKLANGRPLRIKHGVDPTTKDLHLGYAVIYEKLRQFQEAGHRVVFLIGGFTARFGDPTDRLEQRPLRSAKEVEALAKQYIAQLGKILDTDKIEIRSNAEWYEKMSAEGLLKILSTTSVQRMLERDMFQKRMAQGLPIGLHEVTYPILQGHDSVMLKADATVIGQDQTFNELQARPLQQTAGQQPQDLIIMPLLVGTDGKRKMSQSYGNSINFNDSPTDMYGKIMSIPDGEIVNYFNLVTRVSLNQVREIEQGLKQGDNPRDAKARLAQEIVKIYHSAAKAAAAGKEFSRVFRERQSPTDITTVKINAKEPALVELLVKSKMVSSKSEARRLISQGAVEYDGRVLSELQGKVKLKPEAVLRVGKRRFVRVKVV